jgi:hypothetical protein
VGAEIAKPVVCTARASSSSGPLAVRVTAIASRAMVDSQVIMDEVSSSRRRSTASA